MIASTSFSNKPLTLVTANQRLSMYFGKQYDNKQITLGKLAWESLDAVPLTSWITRLYNTLPQAKLILTEYQELVLWEFIIANNSHHVNSELALLRTSAIAQMARQAWTILKQWEIPITLLENIQSEEVQSFYHWATKFESFCLENDWVSMPQCVEKLIQYFSMQNSLPSSHFMLAGFEEIMPQVKSLLNVLSVQHTIEFSTPQLSKKTSEAFRVSLTHEEEELYVMANWACKIWKENPKATIGCVVPNLTKLNTKIHRIFTEVFKNSALFNISGGFSFSHFDIVKSALQFLDLNFSVLTAEQVSKLLLSPYLRGSVKEISQRAAVDFYLRDIGESHFTWEKVLEVARKFSCSILISLNQDFDVSQKKYIFEWADFFQKKLQSLGWPGDRVLNSTEHQQVQKWHEILIEFSRLDIVINKKISSSDALYYLKVLIEHTLFQAKKEEAPVQVLGILEATGLPFDFLWVSGMTEENWPQSPSPNPFLPIELQRKFNTPHASAERELEFSQKMTLSFMQNASHVIFSHSLQEKDKALKPSSLIIEIPEITIQSNFPSSINDGNGGLFNGEIETLLDEQGPLFSDVVVRGGASVFKDQAACPFRAFAKFRLRAKKLPIRVSGITLRERGTYVHEALQEIWEVLGDHDTLCKKNEEELDHLINTIVKKMLFKFSFSRPFALKPQFMEIESKRLSILIKRWLMLEKERPSFKVISTETKQEIHFSGLTFNVRIDRMDEELSGARFILDYKTGEVSLNDWFGERPDDLQLPLYAIVSEHLIEGLLFAQLRADKIQFKGITSNDCGIKGVKTIEQQKFDISIQTWEAFQACHQRVLTQLAQEFKDGFAKVDPKNKELTCVYCDLKPLCRVQ